jgi:tRNA pseudouridine32 synthase/23S rRNA pseudouridine746 synthase
LIDTPLDDFRRPLQLLATTLEFTDPVTGEPRRFTTGRTLAAWKRAARTDG